MSDSVPLGVDCTVPPFDQYLGLRRLAVDRRGPSSVEYARYQLYVARDRRSQANVLIKVTSKPGLVYERDLVNEIACLTTINKELPDSRHFPLLMEHGRLGDSRVYLTTSLFDEWPLETTIGPERIARQHVAHLKTALEIGRALSELHGVEIYHVDLHPMNILYRWEGGRPIIRIVDLESSYQVARHGQGVFYNPPTTTGFTAPEVPRKAPDARADVYSLGAVLYTMLAGYEWTWSGDAGRSVQADAAIAPELKRILLTAVDADPDRRFPSADELCGALAAYVEEIFPQRSA